MSGCAAEGSKIALREVLARFGFQIDAGPLKAADRGIDGLIGKLETFGTALAGIGAIHWLNDMAEQLDVLDDLSTQLSVGTDELQLWGFAAKLNGSNAEEMNGALERLQKSLGGLEAEGKAQADAFKRMGIEAKDGAGNVRPMSELLDELPGAFAGLGSDAEKARVATTLFGRAGARLIPLLSQGEKGMAALREEFEALGGGASEESIRAAGEYRDGLVKLDLAFFSLKTTLGGAVFPMLTRVVETVSRGVAKFSAWFKETTALDTAVGMLAAGIALKLGAALAPYLLPGLKFAALFLAVDDFVAFLRGKDSVIGDLLNRWFGPGSAAKARKFFQDVAADFDWFLGAFRAKTAEQQSVWDDNWDILVEGVRTGDLWEKWHTWLTDAAVASDSFIVGVTAGFVDGLAYIAQIFGTLIYEFTHGFEMCTLAWNTGIADFNAVFANGMLDAEKAWNNFVSKLHLPDFISSALSLDTSGAENAVKTAQGTLAGLQEQGRAKLPNNPIRDIAGAAGQVVNAPVQIPVVNIFANPGEKVDKAAARGVGAAIGNGARGAYQSLVQTVKR